MINKYHQITGGGDTYYFLLTRLLEAERHQVIPFCMSVRGNEDSPYASYFVQGLTFRNWRTASRADQLRTFVQSHYNLQARRAIERLINHFKPDLAHIHNILFQLSPSVLDPLIKHQIPVVQTLHDYHLVCPSGVLYAQGQICERCKTPFGLVGCIGRRCFTDSVLATFMAVTSFVSHRAFGLYEPRVNHFMPPSHFTKNKLAEFGIKPTKMTVIPHPVEVSRFVPHHEVGDYVLFVGRIVKYKGIETLVRALAGRNIRLVIVGGGSANESQRLKQLISSSPGNNIEWVGPKSSQETMQYIQASRFVIVPSEWYENHPAVIREAFALGKPVVASRIGGIPELVDQDTGRLFEPGNSNALWDTVCELSRDEPRIRDLGKNARRRAETDLNPEQHLEQISALYDSLVKRRNESAY